MGSFVGTLSVSLGACDRFSSTCCVESGHGAKGARREGVGEGSSVVGFVSYVVSVCVDSLPRVGWRGEVVGCGSGISSRVEAGRRRRRSLRGERRSLIVNKFIITHFLIQL